MSKATFACQLHFIKPLAAAGTLRSITLYISWHLLCWISSIALFACHLAPLPFRPTCGSRPNATHAPLYLGALAGLAPCRAPCCVLMTRSAHQQRDGSLYSQGIDHGWVPALNIAWDCGPHCIDTADRWCPPRTWTTSCSPHWQLTQNLAHAHACNLLLRSLGPLDHVLRAKRVNSSPGQSAVWPSPPHARPVGRHTISAGLGAHVQPTKLGPQLDVLKKCSGMVARPLSLHQWSLGSLAMAPLWSQDRDPTEGLSQLAHHVGPDSFQSACRCPHWLLCGRSCCNLLLQGFKYLASKAQLTAKGLCSCKAIPAGGLGMHMHALLAC
jgi:hypothetical protein